MADFGLTALAALGTAASAVGTVVGASAAEEQGKNADRAAQMQALALQREAREKEAAAQRRAITEQTKADLVLSRQQAVAAASGGGATDPTVLDIMGNTAQQGRYNADSALYEGAAAGQSLDEQAALTRYRGQQARRAGRINSMTTVLSGMSNFATSASRIGLRTPTL